MDIPLYPNCINQDLLIVLVNRLLNIVKRFKKLKKQVIQSASIKISDMILKDRVYRK